MKALAVTLGAVLLAVAAACDTPSGISAPPAARTPGATAPRLTTNTLCYDSMPAAMVDSLPTEPTAIATNCGPETCGGTEVGEVVNVLVDADGNKDVIVIECDDNSVHYVKSDSTCWNCVEGCADSACPDGAMCTPIPGLPGSDCRAYTCPVGWTLTQTTALTAPTCRRYKECPPPLTVTIDGPSKIKPGAQCTWTATVSGGSGTYTYNWFREVEWVSGASSYTGGRPNGTLLPQFKLRVEVSDGTQGASAELLVKESSTAMVCFS